MDGTITQMEYVYRKNRRPILCALIQDESEVFKLVGPVLIKQELGTAKENVEKRRSGFFLRIDPYVQTR